MPQNARTARILVVDDHVDGLLTLSALLETMGFHVMSTNDATRAVGMAAEFRPDLVILDIGMPKLNGYELARRLRADPRFEHVPLVAVTGYGMEADKERARKFGFAAHLTKPAEPDDLEATVKRLLARPPS